MEADLCGLVVRTLKNHPARRILDSLAKVDCESLLVPAQTPSPDTSSSNPGFGTNESKGSSTAKPAAPISSVGGKPDMAAMLAASMAKRQAQSSSAAESGGSDTGGRPDMAAMLGGALKKKQEAAAESGGSDTGGRPDMAAMLGGALKKKQEGGAASSGPPLGGPFGKGGPPGGLAGALGGLSGGLAGLKKTGGGAGGGRNSAAGLLKQLKKEHERAAAEVASLRARGVNVSSLICSTQISWMIRLLT